MNQDREHKLAKSLARTMIEEFLECLDESNLEGVKYLDLLINEAKLYQTEYEKFQQDFKRTR